VVDRIIDAALFVIESPLVALAAVVDFPNIEADIEFSRFVTTPKHTTADKDVDELKKADRASFPLACKTQHFTKPLLQPVIIIFDVPLVKSVADELAVWIIAPKCACAAHCSAFLGLIGFSDGCTVPICQRERMPLSSPTSSNTNCAGSTSSGSLFIDIARGAMTVIIFRSGVVWMAAVSAATQTGAR